MLKKHKQFDYKHHSFNTKNNEDHTFVYKLCSYVW